MPFLSQEKRSSKAKPSKLHHYFDEKFYRSQVSDETLSGAAALDHYLNFGWKSGFNPHPAFEVEWYLKKYPDVARSGMEPFTHYLEMGMNEGRSSGPNRKEAAAFSGLHKGAGSGEAENIRLVCRSLPQDRESYLVVSHESSRTGAPLLALELASNLKGAGYTVVTLSLLGGDLDDEFSRVSDAHFVVPPHYSSKEDFCFFLFSCCVAFKGAFVNSVVSAEILPALTLRKIPIIVLIHEYLSSYRQSPYESMLKLLARTLVFSTEELKKDALAGVPASVQARHPVYAQGLRATVRDSTLDTLGNVATESDRSLASKLRPPGWEKAFVVLGAGTVTHRKGVDLFFATALHLMRTRPDTRFRFVWIGKDPMPDGEYSLLLQDQLRRSGLGEVAVILDEVEDLLPAYRACDAFYLSSRLDPLPLVAQEALAHGRPVLCFEKGNGIAPELKTNTGLAQGVLPYLDTVRAAEVLGGMAVSSEAWTSRRPSIAKWARDRFDFPVYFGKLLSEVPKAEELMEQEIRDTELIDSKRVLNESFMGNMPFPEIFNTSASAYVRGWAGGGFRRKPFPGFHPGIYAERCGVRDRDPLAHFLAAGSPPGPWSCPVIGPEPLAAQPSSASTKVGLHLHMHYTEQVEEIYGRLQKNVLRPVLWITVNDPAVHREVERVFLGYQGSWEIIEVPNRGRDIGPFLTGVGPARAGSCEIVGHLHTKKSEVYSNRRTIEAWCHFLWENALGGEYPMMDRIVSKMSKDSRLGLVFPDDPGIYGWGECLDALDPFYVRMGFTKPCYSEIHFPSGSFFWARPRALEPLWRAGFGWEDYPLEPVPYCGTMLHGIERIFPLVAEQSGYQIATTHISGVTR